MGSCGCKNGMKGGSPCNCANCVRKRGKTYYRNFGGNQFIGTKPIKAVNAQILANKVRSLGRNVRVINTAGGKRLYISAQKRPYNRLTKPPELSLVELKNRHELRPKNNEWFSAQRNKMLSVNEPVYSLVVDGDVPYGEVPKLNDPEGPYMNWLYPVSVSNSVNPLYLAYEWLEYVKNPQAPENRKIRQHLMSEGYTDADIQTITDEVGRAVPTLANEWLQWYQNGRQQRSNIGSHRDPDVMPRKSVKWEITEDGVQDYQEPEIPEIPEEPRMSLPAMSLLIRLADALPAEVINNATRNWQEDGGQALTTTYFDSDSFGEVKVPAIGAGVFNRRLSNMYVNQLPIKNQRMLEKRVRRRLQQIHGKNNPDLESWVNDAMSSRLSDLTDLIGMSTVQEIADKDNSTRRYDMTWNEWRSKFTGKMPGEFRLLRLPYSEVNVSMGVAGEYMIGQKVGNGVQLYRINEDSSSSMLDSKFSFPISPNEAGWDMSKVNIKSGASVKEAILMDQATTIGRVRRSKDSDAEYKASKALADEVWEQEYEYYQDFIESNSNNTLPDDVSWVIYAEKLAQQRYKDKRQWNKIAKIDALKLQNKEQLSLFDEWRKRKGIPDRVVPYIHEKNFMGMGDRLRLLGGQDTKFTNLRKYDLMLGFSGFNPDNYDKNDNGVHDKLESEDENNE